jgi:uncharacterized protein
MLIKSIQSEDFSRLTLKERYKVDFPAQMAECEVNYHRLMKLIGDYSEDNYRFLIQRGQHQWLQLLSILERSPYTTTLSWRQLPLFHTSLWLSSPKLTIRLYQDAQLAEVLAWEGHRRLRPRYEYPNKAMYLADEKRQLNRFLSEWLDLCLAQGQMADLQFVTNPSL